MVGALTEADIVAARAELALERPVAVWFTPEAVGVAPGSSARIISIGEQPEGEFIQVRPTGSRDEMFCSPGELTRTRPPRRRADKEAAPAPASAQPVKRAAAAAVATSTRSSTPVEAPTPPAAAEKPVRRPRTEPVDASAAEPASAAPARKRASKSQPVEVTVSLHAGVEGEWQVSVVAGKRTVVRPTAIPAADVAKAAQCLPAEVSAAVQDSLAAARTRQLERVAQLRAELEAAQQTLSELGG